MAIYVQIGKKDEIKGNVSAKKYENWIECTSFGFGVGRSIPMAVGRQTEREASLPSFSELSLTKTMDDSSPYLFQESVSGEGKMITIHVTKTGKAGAESVVEYVLTSGMLSSYSVSGDGGLMNESISFAFTKIEMKYILWDEDHKVSSQVPVLFDLGTATIA